MSFLDGTCLLFILLAIQTVFGYDVTHTEQESLSLHLLVVVSVPSHGEAIAGDLANVPKWERGHEILSGAHVAIEEINRSSILRRSGHHIDIIPLPIITTECNINSVLVGYVQNLETTKNIVGITGYFCNNIGTTFTSRALIGGKSQQSYTTIQISTSTDYPPESKTTGTHYVLPPLTAYAKALVSLLAQIGWSRISILKTGTYHDTYYSRLAETFGQLIGSHRIIYKNEINDDRLLNLTELWRSGTKVVVGFLIPSHACKVISSAYREGLTWPDYAWIMVDNDIDDLLSCGDNDTSLKEAKEKVILVHRYPLFASGDAVLPSGKKYRNYSLDNGINNSYANILYDSVWALGLALNSSLELIKLRNFSLHKGIGRDALQIFEGELANIAFQGASGFLNFSQRTATQISVGIFQFQRDRIVKLGLYNMSHHLHVLNSSLLSNIPSDELERVYQIYPLTLTILLSIVAIAGLILTTTILVLFVYFRAEPEIKAASRYLSLCMFFGCYTLLLASLDYTILSGIVIPQDNFAISAIACVLDVSLATLGLDSVLATLFAKMLRIYHIFKKFGKVSRLWSDNGLFVLIVIIVLVKVFFLIIWTSVDINHVVDVEAVDANRVPPYYVVIQKCHCEYFGMWYALTFLYTGTLFSVLLLVAFNTRKIKRANYKDTKKVNLLIATLVGVIIFSSTGWAILQFIDNNASKAIVSIGFAITSILSQSFLLVPKVIPPIRRHFERTFIVEPGTVSTEG
jgi:hypothetical protein